VPSSTRTADLEQAEVGSYFVANYPPFSVWTAEAVANDAAPALASAPIPGNPLGLYLHIPFCRKRCHFCYFRVYTDRNAREIEEYLSVLAREWELYADARALADRPLSFVYFGGGTPSFLSTKQLDDLVKRLTATRPWTAAEEITFECEPGTLTEPKIAAIREIGVTRLSLGIENFDDRILELNGRAHRSPEIGQSYRYARAMGFPQINIDLIAGMLGETDANWTDCVRRTLDLEPDSVTIYQMELPYNTTIAGDLLKGSGRFAEPLANWPTKRRWVAEAFDMLERAGYHIGVYGGQGSSDDEVRLPGSALAGRRHARPGRRVFRPRQRRAHPERRYLGGVQPRRRIGSASARPRVPADARGTDDSRVRAAAEARMDQRRLLLDEIRRRCPQPLQGTARVA